MSKQYTGKKREVQYHFYNKVQTKSNVVALAGNNLDLHINDFKHIINTPKSQAFVYDLNIEVINKFKYLQDFYKIQLIQDNIVNCRIERCMDLDLMTTLNDIQGIVYYLFNEQYNKYRRTTRSIVNTFMFTYCLRNNRKDKANLNSFLDSILLGKNLTIINKEFITYRDGAPMCTVQIQYNL